MSPAMAAAAAIAGRLVDVREYLGGSSHPADHRRIRVEAKGERDPVTAQPG
jgi:hypothetical protein